jgi:hypothetical protein
MFGPRLQQPTALRLLAVHIVSGYCGVCGLAEAVHPTTHCRDFEPDGEPSPNGQALSPSAVSAQLHTPPEIASDLHILDRFVLAMRCAV